MSMRSIDVIDRELRLLSAVQLSIREHGGRPSIDRLDELLEERLAADTGRAMQHPAS